MEIKLPLTLNSQKFIISRTEVGAEASIIAEVVAALLEAQIDRFIRSNPANMGENIV